MEIEIRYIGKSNWEGLKTDEVLRVEKGATVADLLTRLIASKKPSSFS